MGAMVFPRDGPTGRDISSKGHASPERILAGLARLRRLPSTKQTITKGHDRLLFGNGLIARMVGRMDRASRRSVLLGGLALVGGCGFFRRDEPGDPCATDADEADGVKGVFLRERSAAGDVTLVAATGTLARNGTLRRLDLGTGRLRLRAEGDALVARNGLRAEPLDAFAALPPDARLYMITGADGSREGHLVIGTQTAPDALPLAGQRFLAGPAQVTLSDRRDGADPTPRDLTATARATAGFGSDRVSLQLLNLQPAGGPALDLRQVDWSGLAICGTRVASAGSGGFLLRGQDGAVLNLVGAGPESELGSAILDARFYGDSDDEPATLAGGFVIAGDTGVLSAVFALTPVGSPAAS